MNTIYKIIFISSLISFFFNSINSQTINSKTLKATNKQTENYSKADWEGQGMYRNYKPEDEIIEKCTRSAKHFRNPDGTVTALIAAGASLNYEENGSWHSITREIEPNNSPAFSQYPYANTHNAFKSYYPNAGGSDGILTILKEGTINEWVNPSMYYIVNNEKVNFQKINAANIHINDNEIIYKNIFNDIDVKFIQNNDGRKMNIILNDSNAISNAPVNATYLVFEEIVNLPKSWVIKEEEGCINVFDENNLWIARYEKPVYFDSGDDTSKNNNHKIIGNYNITKDGNMLIISMLVPIQWLKSNNRQFPVIIDPTVNIYPANTNYYTGSVEVNGTNYIKYNDTMNAGYPGSGAKEYGFMKFDISSLSSAGTFSSCSADINLYTYYLQSTNNFGYIYSSNNDPVTASAYTLFAGLTWINSTYNWNCSSCWYNIAIPTSEISKIINGISFPGWVSYGNFTNAQSSSYGYSNVLYKPYLRVTYCETPGTPSNLIDSITSNTSTNLSWAAGSPVGSNIVRYYWEVYTTGGNYVTGNNTTSTNTSVSGLNPGTSYFFRIQASTTCDNTYSAWDTSAYFTTLSCATPGLPVSLTATIAGQNSAALQWTQGTPSGSTLVTYYWEVYTSGGNLITNGNTTGLSAVASNLSCGTTYYFRVRANTSCDNSFSLWVTSSNFTTSPCCTTPGIPLNLMSTLTGGTSANLEWSAGNPVGSQLILYYWEVYSSGGIYVTGGSSLSTNTSVSNLLCGTTYYFRVQSFSTCNNTYSAWAYSPDFNSSAVPPMSLSSDRTNFCSDDNGSINLTASGGTGNTLYWYSSSCNGTSVGTGNPLTLASPSATTFYYANWYIQGCSITTCQSVTVSVYPAPVAPVLANTDRNNFCDNDTGNINLSISGGSGAMIEWYTGSCGGTTSGTGNYFQIASPTCTTTYWVNMQTQGCSNTSCISIVVSVIPSPNAPQVITSDMNNYCSNTGGHLILNSYGGSGSTLQWSFVNCGGTVFGTGSSLTFFAPIVTTTYYNWWEQSGCGNTSCVSLTVNVLQLPSPVSSISGLTSVCNGNIATYSVSNSAGINYLWYAPTGWSGTSITNSITLTVGNLSGNISVMPVNTCGNGILSSIYVDVDTPSVSADSAVAVPLTICPGNYSSLNISGGSLGNSANWSWYSGLCGGIFSSTGASINISPLSTTTYFIRAEGLCNTTNCVSIIVNVNLNSVQASSAVSNPSEICPGDSSILNFSGGSPGTSAIWKWYSGTCGGILTGTGISVVQSPTTSTTYYLRAEGYCNTTACISTEVSIALNSLQNAIATASEPIICPGANDTLSVAGGILYTNSDWYWYSGTCGDTLSGIGASIIINPIISKTYFVRIEGNCNTTNCESVSVTIGNITSAPIFANSDRNNYCSSTGGTISLSVSGGNGEVLRWYKASCGGTLVGTGNPKVITAPIVSTTYFAMWQTPGCSNSQCVSKIVTVLTSPVAPATLHFSTNNICSNFSGTISLGASGGTGVTFAWYTGSCGGVNIGTLKNLIITPPTVTTTYWARYQTASCGNSTCKSLIINVTDSLPLQPDTILGIINPLPGDTLVYSVTNTSGIIYTWSAPTGWYGTSTGNSISFVVGSGSGNITVVPSNACGNGVARTLDVSTGYSISGYFSYGNSFSTPMDSVRVFLLKNGNLVDSTQADISGYYQFNKISNGIYNITALTHKPWGGVNSTDAVKVKRHFAGSELFTTSIQLHAADVNLSFGINTTDAVKITRRFVGSDTTFTRGDWIFEKPIGGDTINVSVNMNDTVIVNGNNVTQNFIALCIGDVNGSNYPLPGAKYDHDLLDLLDLHDFMRSKSNEMFELPILASSDIKVSAISMILKFPKNLVEIDNVKCAMCNEEILTPNPLKRGYNYKNEGIGIEGSNLIYNVMGDELRIGWFANVETQSLASLHSNMPIIIIRGKTTANFKHGDVIKFTIANNPLCEFADEDGNSIDNVVLKTYIIEYSDGQNIENIGSGLNNDFFIFPNPAENVVNIRYNIANDGYVNISLYNVLGEKLIDVVNNYVIKGVYKSEVSLSSILQGVYTCKMVLGDYTVIIKRFIVSK